MDAQGAIDERTLGRLRWRARRGLLENDLFLQRFFDHHGTGMSQAAAEGLQALLALPDPDLLDLFLGRREPDPDLNTREVNELLALIRRGSDGPATAVG